MTTEAGPETGLNAAMAATLNGERVASRMTFDDLSIATGIPKRTLLRKISTTERHLNVEDVRRIASALGLTVIDAITRAEERNRRAAAEAMSEELPMLRAVADKSEIEEAGEFD